MITILSALALATGVAYAYFTNAAVLDNTITFGDLTEDVTITKSADATFTAAGQRASATVELTANDKGLPFGYSIEITPTAADSEIASSVFVYFDGEFLGTVASVFPAAAGETAAFTAKKFDPDRVLGAASTAEHTFELEYHLGAAAFHEGKSLAFDVTCTTYSLDAAATAYVTDNEELNTLLADAEAGLLPDGYRIVLGADDLAAARAYNFSKPITLDLNGHSLDTTAGGMTFGSDTAAAVEYGVISYPGTTAAISNISVAGSAYVRVNNAAVTFSAWTADAEATAKQQQLMSAYARAALKDGVKSAFDRRAGRLCIARREECGVHCDGQRQWLRQRQINPYPRGCVL